MFNVPEFLAGMEQFWREYQLYQTMANSYFKAAKLCAGTDVYWINEEEPQLVFVVAEGEEADDIEEIRGGDIDEVYRRYTEKGEEGIREWIAEIREARMAQEAQLAETRKAFLGNEADTSGHEVSDSKMAAEGIEAGTDEGAVESHPEETD